MVNKKQLEKIIVERNEEIRDLKTTVRNLETIINLRDEEIRDLKTTVTNQGVRLDILNDTVNQLVEALEDVENRSPSPSLPSTAPTLSPQVSSSSSSDISIVTTRSTCNSTSSPVAATRPQHTTTMMLSYFCPSLGCRTILGQILTHAD